jgi:TonB family protein
MKPFAVPKLAALFVVGIAVAFAVVTTPSEVVKAGDLYATGIGYGKTKPLIEIENKLVPPPKERPIREVPLTVRKQLESDTVPTVEDARKYQLYIEPVFPRGARLALKQGVVELQLTFDKNGKMKDARVLKCSTPDWGFEQAVLAASLESRLKGHGDREITVKATVKFQLE